MYVCGGKWLGEDAYVISVGAGKNQIPLVQRLVERGYIVVAFDKNKSTPGKQLSHIFNTISTAISTTAPYVVRPKKLPLFILSAIGARS